MINERDIFNYIFNKETLDEEKLKIIESGNLYENEIKYYNEIKNSLSENITDNEKERIAELIPGYKLEKGIILNLILPRVKTDTILKYSASSSSLLEKKTVSQTFMDAAEKYLIRVNIIDDTTKVFIFSVKNEKLNDLKIIFSPSKTEYTLKNTNEPLVIQERVEISSIKIFE